MRIGQFIIILNDINFSERTRTYRTSNFCLFGFVWFCFTAYQPHRLGGARGVMVIVVGHGHGDTSSNPGRD